jgi:hypothetical protein
MGLLTVAARALQTGVSKTVMAMTEIAKRMEARRVLAAFRFKKEKWRVLAAFHTLARHRQLNCFSIAYLSATSAFYEPAH